LPFDSTRKSESTLVSLKTILPELSIDIRSTPVVVSTPAVKKRSLVEAFKAEVPPPKLIWLNAPSLSTCNICTFSSSVSCDGVENLITLLASSPLPPSLNIKSPPSASRIISPATSIVKSPLDKSISAVYGYVVCY